MNIFKELKVRILYKREMELWDYKLRMNIVEAVGRKFLRGGMWVSDFEEIHNGAFPTKIPEWIDRIDDRRRVNLKKSLES